MIKQPKVTYDYKPFIGELHTPFANAQSDATMKNTSGLEGLGRQKKSRASRTAIFMAPPNMKIGRRPIILIK